MICLPPGVHLVSRYSALPSATLLICYLRNLLRCSRQKLVAIMFIMPLQVSSCMASG